MTVAKQGVVGATWMGCGQDLIKCQLPVHMVFTCDFRHIETNDAYGIWNPVLNSNMN